MGKKTEKKMIKAYKRVQRMTKLRDKGLSMDEIGKIFGISRQRVSKLFQEQKVRIDKLKKRSILN
jgi:transcriptional regulator